MASRRTACACYTLLHAWLAEVLHAHMATTLAVCTCATCTHGHQTRWVSMLCGISNYASGCPRLQAYSEHAGKAPGVVEMDDVMLAIQVWHAILQ
eukprot:359876-Chlamydomonas_euryale.AAC.9